LIVRAAGTVLIFMPLNMAALGPIPTKEVAAATGFFNLTRQLGGSVGVAMLTTLLADRTALHGAMLREALSASDPRFAQRPASVKSLAALDGSVTLQSAVMSFGDTFLVIGAFIVLTLPLVLLLGRPPKGQSVAGAH